MLSATQDKDRNSAPPRLLEQVRRRARAKHLSRRTEQACTHWIKRYILHHNKRHPCRHGSTGGRGIPFLAGNGANNIDITISSSITEKLLLDELFPEIKSIIHEYVFRNS